MVKYFLSALMVLTSVFAYAGRTRPVPDTPEGSSVSRVVTRTSGAVTSAVDTGQMDSGYMQFVLSADSKQYISSISRNVLGQILEDKELSRTCNVHLQSDAQVKKPRRILSELSQQLQFVPGKFLGQQFHATFRSPPKEYSYSLTNLKRHYQASEKATAEEERVTRLAEQRATQLDLLSEEIDIKRQHLRKLKQVILDLGWQFFQIPKGQKIKFKDQLKAIMIAIDSEKDKNLIYSMFIREYRLLYKKVLKEKNSLKKTKAGLEESLKRDNMFNANKENEPYPRVASKKKLEERLVACLKNKKSSVDLKKCRDAEYGIRSVKPYGQFIALVLKAVSQEDLPELHISLIKLFCSNRGNSVLTGAQQDRILEIVRSEVSKRRQRKKVQSICFDRVMARYPTSGGEYEMREFSLDAGTSNCAATTTVVLHAAI